MKMVMTFQDSFILGHLFAFAQLSDSRHQLSGFPLENTAKQRENGCCSGFFLPIFEKRFFMLKRIFSSKVVMKVVMKMDTKIRAPFSDALKFYLRLGIFFAFGNISMKYFKRSLSDILVPFK